MQRIRPPMTSAPTSSSLCHAAFAQEINNISQFECTPAYSKERDPQQHPPVLRLAISSTAGRNAFQFRHGGTSRRFCIRVIHSYLHPGVQTIAQTTCSRDRLRRNEDRASNDTSAWCRSRPGAFMFFRNCSTLDHAAQNLLKRSSIISMADAIPISSEPEWRPKLS